MYFMFLMNEFEVFVVIEQKDISSCMYCNEKKICLKITCVDRCSDVSSNLLNIIYQRMELYFISFCCIRREKLRK